MVKYKGFRNPNGPLLIEHNVTRRTMKPHVSGPAFKRTKAPFDSYHENVGAKLVYSRMETQHTYHVNAAKVGAGAAVAGAAGYGGYQAYQHRDDIKNKAHQLGDKTVNAFHSTRHSLGAHF